METTEITNELKAKFFAQYIGQTVVGHETDNCNFRLTEISLTDCEVGLFGDWSGGTHPQASCNDLIGIDAVWLNLRSLVSITDEDAIEVGFLSSGGFNRNLKVYGEDEFYRCFIRQPEIDYLRSKGYTLPFMGISVEQQVKSGWVKLITDK